ncbi:MAG: hypothetical protein EA370_05625 [Wenzhouxiangella sp.]|nr:MAG: hypothetical protein EA370_05625 [Wenzhouxiangella sp.]
MDSPRFSSQTWDRITELFDRLCDLPAEQRDLARAGLTPAAKRMLDQMLAAYDDPAPGLLDQTLAAMADQLIGEPEADAMDCRDQRFGPWQAIDEIGRGGMGLVLKAERADGQFEKEVALKVLLRPDHGLGQERLGEEIRILARLEHPNIARLIDGGISESGLSYLVMELVDGVPISDYCERHKLDQHARVALLVQVLEAVQFAHRHLIVHCDIKPANVLVSADGQVKLVDFGIAALARAGKEGQPRGVFCSPTWCAPEQLRGEPPATSQDIFALGALLYELLCGRPIRNQATATRLVFGGARTLTPPPPLIEHCPDDRYDRDLDAICQRALQAEPGHRYNSAAAMAADLRAWERHHPVSARNGGRAYVLGKWLRRNRWPSAAAGLAALALVGGSALALWQAHEARQAQHAAESELARANELHGFLLALFEGARLGQPRDEVPGTRELLMRGAERARLQLSDQPALKAELLAVIGGLLRNVGLTHEGRDMLAEAVELQQSLFKRGDQRWLSTQLEYALALHYSGAPAEAAQQLETVLEQLRVQASPETLVRALHAYGFALSELLQFDQALAAHHEALSIQRDSGDEPDQMLGEGLAATARTLARAGQLEDAAALYEQALFHLRETVGTADLTTVSAMSDYGVALRRLERYRQAETVLREAIAASTGLYTGPHVTTAQRWNNLGAVLVSLGDRPGAIEAFEQALAILSAQGDGRPGQVLAGPLNNLGFLSLSVGDYERAEDFLRQALVHVEASLGRDSAPHIAVSTNLGRSLLLRGQHDQARAILVDALERASAAFDADDDRVLNLESALAQLDWQQHRDPAGLARLHSLHTASLEARGEDHPGTARHGLTLADALVEAGSLAPAADLYRQVLSVSEQHHGPSHPQSLAARIGLAETLELLGQPDASEALLDAIPPELVLAPGDPINQRMSRLRASPGNPLPD